MTCHYCYREGDDEKRKCSNCKIKVYSICCKCDYLVYLDDKFLCCPNCIAEYAVKKYISKNIK